MSRFDVSCGTFSPQVNADAKADIKSGATVMLEFSAEDARGTVLE